MKITTYNVNGVNGRLPVLLKWLESAKPDVVCLQELKAPQEKFPINEINEAGYQAIWHGQKQWNGVAILTKDYEMTEVQRTLPGNTDESTKPLSGSDHRSDRHLLHVSSQWKSVSGT